MSKTIKDPWLIGVCTGRMLLYGNFMVYAASLPLVREQWQMTGTQAGSISSSFMFGYALSLVLFSWLADRLGARRVVLWSAWASALSAVLFGVFANSYISALMLYALAAFTQGGTYTPLVMLFADRYPPQTRGRTVGWLVGSTSIGYALSLLITGVTLAWGGYRLAYIVTGLMPLAGALILQTALRSTANRIHPRPQQTGVVKRLWHNRDARYLIAGYTAHAWELLGMWSWLPAFLAASMMISGNATLHAAETGAYLTATLHIVGAFAATSMGRLSDRLGRRSVLFGLAAVSALFSLTIGWLVAWPLYLMVLLALVYNFAAIGDSPVLSTAITEVTEPGYLGAVLALRSLLGFGAGTISPLVFGLVLDISNPVGTAPVVWGWAFMMLGVGGVMAAVCAYSLTIRR